MYFQVLQQNAEGLLHLECVWLCHTIQALWLVDAWPEFIIKPCDWSTGLRMFRKGWAIYWGAYADSEPVFKYSNRGQAGIIECTVVQRQDSSINVQQLTQAQCVHYKYM